MVYGWTEKTFNDIDITQALNEWYIDECKEKKDADYRGEERLYQSPVTKLGTICAMQ